MLTRRPTFSISRRASTPATLSIVNARGRRQNSLTHTSSSFHTNRISPTNFKFPINRGLETHNVACISLRRPLSGYAALKPSSMSLVQVRCYASQPDRIPVPPIPRDKLTITFSTSSGPGGQNVNKVNTKAELRFSPATADWLPDQVKTRFIELFSHKMNKNGEVIIMSQTHRTQKRNAEECIRKLIEMIDEAAIIPKEREETEVPEYAKEKRLKEKKIRSQIKKFRNAPISY